jgi:hypothetical protein
MPTEENWGEHKALYSRENQEKEKKIKMEKQESCAAQLEKLIRVHSQTNTKRGIQGVPWCARTGKPQRDSAPTKTETTKRLRVDKLAKPRPTPAAVDRRTGKTDPAKKLNWSRRSKRRSQIQ